MGPSFDPFLPDRTCTSTPIPETFNSIRMSRCQTDKMNRNVLICKLLEILVIHTICWRIIDPSGIVVVAVDDVEFSVDCTCCAVNMNA